MGSPSPSRRRSSSTSSNLSALLSDSDPTLAAIQSQRLEQLRSQQSSQPPATSSIAANAPGHGRPVVLGEAVAIQTTADAARSLLLFTHADMAACSRMQGHVDELSRRHPNVCCVVVKAEGAEWLAGRMGVRVLPVLVGFLAGKEVGRIVGFEGVKGGIGAGSMEIERTVGDWGVVDKRVDSDGEEEDREDLEKNVGRSIRSGNPRARRTGGTEEDDDSDWD
jgi:hypothetical protein